MTLIQWLDYAGVAVFALSGGITAARKRLDPVGFALIGTVTGIGGGTLRDLLLDRPVYWITQWEYLVITLLAAWAVFVWGRFAPRPARPVRWSRLLDWADAVGLSVFALIGAQAALSAGANGFIAVVMGMMTASFGGLLRDILCNEIPMILHREIYASAAAAGAAVYVLGLKVGWPHDPTLTAGAGTALALRGLGITRGWHLPAYEGGAHHKP